MQKPIFAAALLALLATGAASAQIQVPQGQIPQQQQQLPQGATVRPELQIRPPCGGTVDLAIVSATLNKLTRPGDARVEFEVRNVGPGSWEAAPGQVIANLAVRNGASGATYTLNVPIAGRRYAPGERVARVQSTAIANAFDTFEFSGYVDMSLSFDPDIAIDSNRCNDDSNSTNNSFRVDDRGVQAYLSGRPRSRTFRAPGY